MPIDFDADKLPKFVTASCPECGGAGGDEDSGPCKTCGGVGGPDEEGLVSMMLLATVLLPDPYDSLSAGPYFNLDDRRAIEALRPGDRLYVLRAPKKVDPDAL
jgi:hypothetical protein